MDFNIQIGLIGGLVSIISLLISIFVIRRLCDLIIIVVFLCVIVSPYFLATSGTYNPTQIYGIAILFGIIAPIITLPIWSISKIMRGNEDFKITKLEDRIRSLEQTTKIINEPKL